MELARVVGTIVATKKNPEIAGYKLLLVEIADPYGKGKGKYYIGVDLVDAGVGDLVLLVRGSSARTCKEVGAKPVDGSIVAVVDTVNMGNKSVYDKSRGE